MTQQIVLQLTDDQGVQKQLTLTPELHRKFVELMGPDPNRWTQLRVKLSVNGAGEVDVELTDEQIEVTPS